MNELIFNLKKLYIDFLIEVKKIRLKNFSLVRLFQVLAVFVVLLLFITNPLYLIDIISVISLLSIAIGVLLIFFAAILLLITYIFQYDKQ